MIDAEKASYRVSVMTRVLGVSGYYAWRDRGPSARETANTRLSGQMRSIDKGSRETYGSPRIHAELRCEGTRVGRKRVARLMGAAGLAECRSRRPTW